MIMVRLKDVYYRLPIDAGTFHGHVGYAEFQ